MKSPTPAFLVLITFATTWMLALLTTGQLFGTGEDSPLKVERKAVARVVKNKCVLPHWVEAGSQVMADEIVNGSLGLTDKVRHRHDYEFMYYPYMSNYDPIALLQLRRRIQVPQGATTMRTTMAPNQSQCLLKLPCWRLD
jgi:hypothetical protein